MSRIRPAKIKTAASVAVKTLGAFDFVCLLNDQAELIRFRDSLQLAVLDLHRPKRPTLKVVNTLNEPGYTESLGETGFLVINESYNDVGPVAHDYQVVDISNRTDPIALATIKQVKQRVVNEETGTTYLLASDGLTVVRRPRVEDDYKARQRSQMEED